MGHGQTKQILSRGSGPGGPDGAGAAGEARLPVNGDHLDRRKARLYGGDLAQLGAAGRAGCGPPRGTERRRSGAGSGSWSARTSSCGGPTRSCGRPRHISPRRSSTAERSDGGLHRCPPRGLRGRPDLCRPADRPVAVLRAQGPGPRACAPPSADATGRNPGRAGGPRVAREPGGLRGAQGLGATPAGRTPDRPLHGGAADATTRPSGRGAGPEVQGDDHCGRGRSAAGGPGHTPIHGGRARTSCGSPT